MSTFNFIRVNTNNYSSLLIIDDVVADVITATKLVVLTAKRCVKRLSFFRFDVDKVTVL